MKFFLSFMVGGILLLCGFVSGMHAQDWKKVDPEMNKILVDTTLVRAAEVTILPGQKTGSHTHPAHFFYALTDGKIIVHYSDGTHEEWELKAGESAFSDPERPHVTENAGKKPVKFLLVELKEHPYKASEMK